MSLKPEILKMQFVTSTAIQLPRDLGNGLVMRIATAADAQALAQFNGWVHGGDHFDEFAAGYTYEYMSEAHPAIGPSNVLIVEDTRMGKIASTTDLIPQIWTYAGIPFGVGRPEMVGTAPEYRRHGLVRAQFEVLHAMSEAMGHQVQSITGIPWFYRQFGYEFAIDLDGGRSIYFDAIPKPQKPGPGVTISQEEYHLRPMSIEDIPFVAGLYERDCMRSLVACVRSQELWQFLVTGGSPQAAEHRPFQIVEAIDAAAPGPRRVGYLATSRELRRGMFYAISELAFVEEQSIRAALPAILRALESMGRAEGEKQKKEVKGLYLKLGREHPAYNAVPDWPMRTDRPYGWYIRVVDVPAFIRHVAPELEKRLAHSALAGHTGEIKINSYQDGMRLIVEHGKIRAEPWVPIEPETDAGFPPLVFLQLLFGRHALAELREFYPDCWAKDDAAVLLEALFPKRYSCVVPVS